MIGGSIKAVIDLLMIRKQEKKLDIEIAKGPLDIEKARLEVEKLKREAEPESGVVGPDRVSVEDIQKFDPRAAAIHRMAQHSPYAVPEGAPRKRQARSKSIGFRWIVLVLALVVLGLAVYWKQ